MMNQNLEHVLRAVQKNKVTLKSFSSDERQVNQEGRVISISRILERIPLPKNSTIMDIGTGYGYGAVLLHALGYTVIGIESNADKLSEGMNYWRLLGIDFQQIPGAQSVVDKSNKLYFLQRDARDLYDFADGSIDMATAFYISGYMVKGDGAFRQVARLLSPIGHLTITTEGQVNMPSIVRGSIVRLASRALCPPDLRCVSIQKLSDPDIYDRFVITYAKK